MNDHVSQIGMRAVPNIMDIGMASTAGAAATRPAGSVVQMPWVATTTVLSATRNHIQFTKVSETAVTIVENVRNV